LYQFSGLKKAFPEIPPVLPFSKGGEIFPPLLKGRCEKIRFADEISFSRCPGDGKIRAGKIGGTGMILNALPTFREGTQATWNKIM